MTDVLKDFFYLDIEKVRSFVAQLREGLPDAFEKTQLHRGAGGINFGVRADYAYERAETETRSLHHYLYMMLEKALHESGRLLVIDESFDPSDWKPEVLTDGRFVLVEGTVTLLDFQTAVDALQGLPRIMEVSAHFQQQSLAKQLKAGEISQLQYQQALSQTKAALPARKDVDSIANLIRDLYAGLIRTKVRPFDADPSKYFAGALHSQNLQRERASVYATGQASPAAKWKAFGLVDQVVPAQPAAANAANLEEMIDNMLMAFNEISRFTTASTWPVVSFSPLAIYREV